jgi:hypothetical protein
MLDFAGTLFLVFYLGSILTVVLRQAHSSAALKAALGFLLLWLVLEMALASGASLLSKAVRPNMLMFALSMLLLGAAWMSSPALRRAAAEIPLASLVALHAWRLGGFFFLLLQAAGRAAWPFAPVAAIGDMITGLLASCFAIGFARGGSWRSDLIAAWNGFGLIDLIVAIALAFLSTPGAPFQIFTRVPPLPAFATMPWMMVPVAIVPALIFLHLAIARKLRGDRFTAISC